MTIPKTSTGTKAGNAFHGPIEALQRQATKFRKWERESKNPKYTELWRGRAEAYEEAVRILERYDDPKEDLS